MPRRDEDYDDDDDREPPPRPRRRDDDDDDDYGDESESPVSTIIPYKNGMALGAYYCGVFGLIPCLGLILGPIAFILGILGIIYQKKHPEAKGKGHAIAGVVLSFLDFGSTIVVGLVLWYFSQHP
jgi:hypothetical protein